SSLPRRSKFPSSSEDKMKRPPPVSSNASPIFASTPITIICSPVLSLATAPPSWALVVPCSWSAGCSAAS
ncbi:MAG: hypothetical protein CYG60_02440, partial [Actinobacteria bacterium]